MKECLHITQYKLLGVGMRLFLAYPLSEISVDDSAVFIMEEENFYRNIYI